MSSVLSWRPVALACALLLAAAGVFASWALPGADAQEPPPSATFVFSGIPITASNGNAILLGTGTRNGVLGVACTGHAPRGGTPKVPGMVVTQMGFDETRLRIIQANGVALTGTVTINCVIEFELTPPGVATAERLRAAANAA